MRNNPTSQSGVFNPRVLAALTLCSAAVFLAMLSFAASPANGMTNHSRPLRSKAMSASTVPSASATAGSWSIVPSPNTGDTEYNQLFGVACPSASDCWAVGYSDVAGSHSQTLIEHWDGSSWTIVSSPNSSTSESNFLLGITCTSATDCWAVGHHDSGDVAVFVTLILHYNGTSWSVVSSPNVTEAQDNEFRSVTCTSSADCWAVGYWSIGNPALLGSVITQTLIEHWDGASWTVVNSANSSPAENNNLSSVTCASAANCWAVGYSSSPVNGTLTLIEHFDGTSWSIVSSPNPSPTKSNVPLGVTCMSATDCWLAGYYSGASVTQSLLEHYDGASWNVTSSANTSSTQSNFPFAIACTSATDCWTVGFYYGFPGGNIYTLIDHYDGASWSVVDSPNPPPNSSGQYGDFLWGVTCASTTDCWAVGYYFNVNGVFQNLIEHYTVPPVQLNAVVSRKTHGAAGTFDIVLDCPPCAGLAPPGIECRSGGANGDYTLVFTFANTLTGIGSASVASGTGSVTGSNIDSSDPHNYIVNVTGVTNAQVLKVGLTNVTDSAGNSSSVDSASMGVLIGDTTGNGAVNSSDIAQTQSQSGQAVTASNFREDVTANGLINSSDIALVQSKSGTALP
jgi:hypothetical protein